MKKILQKSGLYAILFTAVFVMGIIVNTTAVYATEEYSIEEISKEGQITNEKLNVRKGPGKNYDSIGSLSPTDIIEITGLTDSGWYRINYNGQEAYAYSEYITTTETSQSSEEADDESKDPEATADVMGADYVEGSSGFSFTQYKIPILIGAVIIITLVIVLTLRSIRKMDDDDYEDDYDDDDDEDDSDNYENNGYYRDEDDDDNYYQNAGHGRDRKRVEPRERTREKTRERTRVKEETSKRKPSKAETKEKSREASRVQEPERRREPEKRRETEKRERQKEDMTKTVNERSSRQPQRQPQRQPSKQPAVNKPGTGADRVIPGQPITGMSDNPDDYKIDIDPSFFENTIPPEPKTDKALDEAMEKLEELQQEITRLKNEK